MVELLVMVGTEELELLQYKITAPRSMEILDLIICSNYTLEPGKLQSDPLELYFRHLS